MLLDAGYGPCMRISASTPISLCFMLTCNDLAVVVRIVFSTSGRTCSRTPLSIACSTIWKTPYLTMVLPLMKPAPEDITSEMKCSAPKELVTTSLTPSTSGAPIMAKVPKRAASR